MPLPSKIARPLYTFSSEDEGVLYDIPDSPVPSRPQAGRDPDGRTFSDSHILPRYVTHRPGPSVSHYPAEPAGLLPYSRRSSPRPHTHVSVSSGDHDSPKPELHYSRRSRSRPRTHISVSSGDHDPPAPGIHQLQEEITRLKIERAALQGKLEGIT